MQVIRFSSCFLAREARALLSRLGRLRPFTMTMPALAAAAVSPAAWKAIESHLFHQRTALKRRVERFLAWLASPAGRQSSPEQQQRAFTVLRLQFNAALDQGDIFADVLTQRGEHENGMWLSGLDVLADDALDLDEPYYEHPPVVTYVDRGHGAAIRRARTRLPGGSLNPVAIIRVPRERMVGSGIGSSLVHEVGHQGVALLDLMASLRPELRDRMEQHPPQRAAWVMWDRWITEIVPDFWAVAKLGVSATSGLIGVVSLPSAFVFRIALDDPHPFPWIRVKLSCAFGRRMYPDPQWDRLEALWERFYPRKHLTPIQHRYVQMLEQTAPELVDLIIEHRPPALHGRSFRQVMPVSHRQPDVLRNLFSRWQKNPALMYVAQPTLVFAVLGQAAADHRIKPETESNLLSRMLRRWAVLRALPAPLQHALRQEPDALPAA